MGNCFCQSNGINQSHSHIEGENRTRVASIIGKHRRLRPEVVKWKSGLPVFRSQIIKKREEFWHTAPAFEGRQEIWDALRAAAETMENGDYELAQAIIDGANIIVPHGYLADCYDELGNRYQLPFYVLSFPINVMEGGSEIGEASSTEVASICALGLPLTCSKVDSQQSLSPLQVKQTLPDVPAIDGKEISSPRQPQLCTAALLKKPSDGLRGLLQISEKVSATINDPSTLQLPCRLSTGQEVLMLCHEYDTVAELKHRLATTLTSLNLMKRLPKDVSLDRQRWFCAGRPLLDNLKISDCHVPAGWIIQVVIHQPSCPKEITTEKIAPNTVDIPASSIEGNS